MPTTPDAASTASLTVVIPVWDDYVRWLPDCISSIANQRPDPPLDILVVDNASGTALPALPAGVGRTRLPTRVSLGAARNHGLARINTPFVAFADADDLFPAGYFAFALARLHLSHGQPTARSPPAATVAGSPCAACSRSRRSS
jgi:glycosyltransferase involved in cell wall biosynthesis